MSAKKNPIKETTAKTRVKRAPAAATTEDGTPECGDITDTNSKTDSVEDPDTPPPGGSHTNPNARHEKMIDLAVKLAAVELANLRDYTPDESRPGIADARYDRVFRDAMRRAEWMLSYPSQDDSLVWAEQLFVDSQDTMSDEDIREVFAEWEWPKLAGRKSICGFLKAIEDWLAQYVEQEEETFSNRFGAVGEAEAAFCSALLSFCGRATGKVMYGPWPIQIQWAASEIVRLVYNQCQHARETSESFEVSCGETVMRSELVKWCIGDRHPQRAYEAMHSNETRVKRYRPWALFRFIRTCRNPSPELEAIREKLRIPRSKLPSPKPPHELLDVCGYPKFDESFFTEYTSSNIPIQLAPAIMAEARSNHDNDPLITPHAALALGATPPSS